MDAPLTLPPSESPVASGKRQGTAGSERFVGTGSALPKRIITNEELSKVVNTTDEWITERVGARQRHVAGEGESTVSLGHQASIRALQTAGWDAKELDLIVLATETPDQLLPSSAALLQNALGASGAMAFDVRAACSGFLFAMTVADGLQQAHGFRRALVVGSETLSRMIDWRDRSTCVLFGDGAGALAMSGDTVKSAAKILATDLHTDGEKNSFICRTGGSFPPPTLPTEFGTWMGDPSSPYVQMKGREVFKSAVTSMASSVERVLDHAGVTANDVSIFIPHQSNLRIIEAVYDKVGLPDLSRVAVNIDRVGNTSAASIPIALDEAVRSGNISPGDLVLMTAVGAGMTYGSVLIRW